MNDQGEYESASEEEVGEENVDEYYKEMEKAMIRANVYEDEEQSIAHFMLGLH